MDCLLSALLLQVQHDASLATVEEVKPLPLARYPHTPADGVACRRLYLHDIGAEVGQVQTAVGRRDDL